jgi:hypothetical protein
VRRRVDAYRLTNTAKPVLRIDEVRGNNPARRNEKEKLLTTTIKLARMSVRVAFCLAQVAEFLERGGPARPAAWVRYR